MKRITEVMNQRIALSKLLSFKQWTGIWSGYCHFDVGYSRRGSFGYNIDVGNGFSTILPATLFAFGMTYDIVPARVLGIIGVALTMFDRRNRLTDQVSDDVRDCLGGLVFETVIPRNVRLSEAPSHGLPALIYDQHCTGSRAYMSLARELIGRFPAERQAA